MSEQPKWYKDRVVEEAVRQLKQQQPKPQQQSK